MLFFFSSKCPRFLPPFKNCGAFKSSRLSLYVVILHGFGQSEILASNGVQTLGPPLQISSLYLAQFITDVELFTYRNPFICIGIHLIGQAGKSSVIKIFTRCCCSDR